MIMSDTPATDTTTHAGLHHVCPWWLGPLLASPVRRLFENPDTLLGPFVGPGMTVLEPGCGMGFFSLSAARLVGPGGKVVCIDVQPRMLAGLRRRARRAGLGDRIETVEAKDGDLGAAGWAGRADVALAIHVVHEVPDARAFLAQIFRAVRPGGLLVFSEPKGHVSPEDFEQTIRVAEEVGFARSARPVVTRSLGTVLEKPALR
jgi:ubiquinone/menaquinone biosynthesis C-methylase UbiE